METFSALPAILTGNSPIAGEFPAQRPVTRSIDIFFDLRRNKRLVNNGEAGNERHRVHYDVTVMINHAAFCTVTTRAKAHITPDIFLYHYYILIFMRLGNPVWDCFV